MRVVTVNVNGIRAAARKGFFEWLKVIKADFVCLQEVRAQTEQLIDPIFFPTGYHHYYEQAEKKGYSGVAIYALNEPKKVVSDWGVQFSKQEGRYLHVEYDQVIIASIYFPSGTSGDLRQVLKYEFMAAFEDHMQALKKLNKPIILCGDWNIAHTEKDIKNWKGNLKNSGFLPEERAWLDKIFSKDFAYVDAFRLLNQSEDQYTWWSQRGRARENNVGWRIDYQVITADLALKLTRCEIYTEQNFSDHAPLIMDYDLVL